MKKDNFTNSSSETIRAAPFQKISNIPHKGKKIPLEGSLFNSWLSGLIDGDGCLFLSKKGYSSCEITLALKEYRLLYNIKKIFGGRVTLRKGVKAIRWRLCNRKGMVPLLHSINGLLWTNVRKKQLKVLLDAFGLPVVETLPFSVDSSWYAGFFEAEGRFHLNTNNLQLSVVISQKDPEVLHKIKEAFGGHVYPDKSWSGWVYSASSHRDLETHIRYFSKFPLGSTKQIQLVRFKRLALYKERGYHLEKDGRRKERFLRLTRSFIEESKKTVENIVEIFKKIEKEEDRVQKEG